MTDTAAGFPTQAFYAAHGRMTSPGRHGALFDGLPTGAGALSEVAQGLIVHEFLTQQYGFEAGRWVLADAQLDDTQRRLFGIDFDSLDVPRDQFVVAGQAWTRYRSGEADPASFGLSAVKEGGDWWIAANIVRDVAALNNMEMLPWDCWGAMPRPGEPIDDERLALFDRLAELTRDPGFARPTLTEMYECDDRLRVPGTVFNAVRDRPEDITADES